MRDGTRCTNMNHGRLNTPVKFCPSCGESVNSAIQKPKCDQFKHNAQRKSRSEFCTDCGKKLS